MSDQDEDIKKVLAQRSGSNIPVDIEMNEDGVRVHRKSSASAKPKNKLETTASHVALQQDVNNGPLFVELEKIKKLPAEERQEKLAQTLLEFHRDRPNARLFHWVGHWRGIVVQYDGLTGQVLDQSVMEVKIGIKGTRFSRLAVRTSKDGSVNRSFGHGDISINDDGLLVGTIKIGDFISQTYALSKHMVAFQIDAVSANKNVHVHGVVTVIDDSTRVSSRQLFLGKRVIIEHSRDTKIFSLPEFLDEDPGETPAVSDDDESGTKEPVRETVFG